jgi:hypothetical protein
VEEGTKGRKESVEEGTMGRKESVEEGCALAAPAYCEQCVGTGAVEDLSE